MQCRHIYHFAISLAKIKRGEEERDSLKCVLMITYLPPKCAQIILRLLAADGK